MNKTFPSNTFLAGATGMGLLLMAFLGFYGEMFVRTRLIQSTDLTLTLQNLQASPALFRSSIATDLLVVLLDVLVALGLHLVLQKHTPHLSLLAATLRVVYAAIYGAVVVFHVILAQLLSAPEAALQAPLISMLLTGYRSGWQFALVFFGFHLLALGVAFIRASQLPTFLGLLLGVAGLSYLADSLAHLLLTDPAPVRALLLPVVALSGVVGELSLCGWLLVQWRNGSRALNMRTPSTQP
ncbi:DUF4386 domain-containing protein [Deinococcus cellulosilyticus]|uniref:DUF4386 domain-containing protein n=1 Tax=Deinococcus cellulosilyticus (strain DSM 18568 / NBRC 106333 / KACC 11606 / 5516J-15) TaxID=1223518 RepID=A0A511N9B6_DEIC1|nr:DUF4386 domain-containing protein [Deinococcus cellulosilyticus]GEM49137.1 DUF4386 domain-containing protein [Deinococcus cellulosilyticus NBRC 106333 = KACC 11606]